MIGAYILDDEQERSEERIRLLRDVLAELIYRTCGRIEMMDFLEGKSFAFDKL